MADKVLVDTSVWIAFFRARDAHLIDRIGSLLKSGKAVSTGIIALELINGAKGQKELQTLDDVFDAMDFVPATEATYRGAGRLGYELARKGFTLGVVDLLIAQTAIESGSRLMTYDEHFSIIAEHKHLALTK